MGLIHYALLLTEIGVLSDLVRAFTDSRCV